MAGRSRWSLRRELSDRSNACLVKGCQQSTISMMMIFYSQAQLIHWRWWLFCSETVFYDMGYIYNNDLCLTLSGLYKYYHCVMYIYMHIKYICFIVLIIISMWGNKYRWMGGMYFQESLLFFHPKLMIWAGLNQSDFHWKHFFFTIKPFHRPFYLLSSSATWKKKWFYTKYTKNSNKL